MFKLDSDGTITMIKGDTGEITMTNLQFRKGATNITMSMAVYNEDYKILSEIKPITISASESTQKMFLPASFSDNIKIEDGEDYADYSYAIKICYTDSEKNRIEETLTTDGTPNSETAIRIYQKRVEGTKETNNG